MFYHVKIACYQGGGGEIVSRLKEDDINRDDTLTLIKKIDLIVFSVKE